MPYIDPTGAHKGWSGMPQPALNMTFYVKDVPDIQEAPVSVTRYQARAALLEAGLLADVEAYFASLPENSLAKLAWQEAPTVSRGSDALKEAARTLGLTGEQMDALFLRANQFV